jgi:hypothetical protein
MCAHHYEMTLESLGLSDNNAKEKINSMTPITINNLLKRGFYQYAPMVNVWRIGTRSSGFELHPNYLVKGEIQDPKSEWTFYLMITPYSNWSEVDFRYKSIGVETMDDIEKFVELFDVKEPNNAPYESLDDFTKQIVKVFIKDRYMRLLSDESYFAFMLPINDAKKYIEDKPYLSITEDKGLKNGFSVNTDYDMITEYFYKRTYINY